MTMAAEIKNRWVPRIHASEIFDTVSDQRVSAAALLCRLGVQVCACGSPGTAGHRRMLCPWQDGDVASADETGRQHPRDGGQVCGRQQVQLLLGFSALPDCRRRPIRPLPGMRQELARRRRTERGAACRSGSGPGAAGCGVAGALELC